MTYVVFHRLAERELIESARFYESATSGLGGDFIQQASAARMVIPKKQPTTR